MTYSYALIYHMSSNKCYRNIADETENQALQMNNSKKRVVMENDTPVYVNNTQIENIETYIYAGQTYSTKNKKQDK